MKCVSTDLSQRGEGGMRYPGVFTMTRQPFVELKSTPLTLFVASKCKYRKKNMTIVDIKQCMIQPSQTWPVLPLTDNC